MYFDVTIGNQNAGRIVIEVRLAAFAPIRTSELCMSLFRLRLAPHKALLTNTITVLVHCDTTLTPG